MSIYEYDEEKHMRFVRQEGMEEGEKRFASLTQLLLEHGRTDTLLQATTDEEYRKKLYLEYNL